MEAAKCDPEFLKWHNMDYDNRWRLLHLLVVSLALYFVVGLAQFSVSTFYKGFMRANYEGNQSMFYQSSTICLEETLTAEDVILNELKPSSSRVESVPLCFCRQEFYKNQDEFDQIDF